MMMKEEVDYIMNMKFDNFVNCFQSELQTQTIPPDDEKLCSLHHRKLKQKDCIGELITDTILNLLTVLMLLFWCHLDYVKFGIIYNYKK